MQFKYKHGYNKRHWPPVLCWIKFPGSNILFFHYKEGGRSYSAQLGTSLAVKPSCRWGKLATIRWEWRWHQLVLQYATDAMWRIESGCTFLMTVFHKYKQAVADRRLVTWYHSVWYQNCPERAIKTSLNPTIYLHFISPNWTLVLSVTRTSGNCCFIYFATVEWPPPR